MAKRRSRFTAYSRRSLRWLARVAQPQSKWRLWKKYKKQIAAAKAMPSHIRITKKVDNFNDLIKRSRHAAERIEQKHAEACASIMRQIMPVDTGAMRESTEAVGQSLQSRTRWGVKIGVNYYGYVNWGTIYQEGQHFIEQAIEFTRPGFMADVARFPSFL